MALGDRLVRPSTPPSLPPLAPGQPSEAPESPRKKPPSPALRQTDENKPPLDSSLVKPSNGAVGQFEPSALPDGTPDFSPIGRLGESRGQEYEALGRIPGSTADLVVNTEGDAGNFLCSHVTRLNNEFRTQNPDLRSGFIHIPQNPADMADVGATVGTGIRGLTEGRSETTVMLTGFTQFGSVNPNATGEFLFGDGVTTDPSSFGFRPSALEPGQTGRNNIDAMMQREFGPPQNVSYFERDGQRVGLSYTYDNPQRTVNLALVRLPVDDNLNPAQRGENNLAGDGTGDTLRAAYNTVRPDAVISLGVGVYDSDNRYVLEVNGPGLDDDAAHYNQPAAPNTSLVDVYRQTMRPR